MKKDPNAKPIKRKFQISSNGRKWGKRTLKMWEVLRPDGCKCEAGHIHDSRGEAGYCNYLLQEKKDGNILDYKTQIKFPLYIDKVLICNHYVDFLIEECDGSRRVDEYKGFTTETWNIKKRLFRAHYKDVPYNVVKHR